jgi:hypothetical protein
MQPSQAASRTGKIQGIDFEPLEVRWQAVANPQSLTPKEQLNILGHAAEAINSAIADGICDEADGKRRTAEWLAAHGVERSIRSLARDLVRFRKRGLLSDGRAAANKMKRAPVLSQADRDALVSCAVFEHGSDVDPAWAQCVREKRISQHLIDRYPLPRNRRPKCPKRIRSQVAAEIARLYPHHLGPRHARLMGADIRRDWSNVPAGAMYSCDDNTPDVYYYVPDGKGWYSIMRGQFLPVVDVRSKKILDFVLIDSRNYTALAIRCLFKRVMSRFGVPDIIILECALWKYSKLVGRGGSSRGYSFPEIEQNFAERLGARIIHALPGNAKAKVIENVFSVFGRHLLGEMGYVGNDEMHVKYERVRAAIAEVEKGPLNGTHPAALGFLSGDEWHARLQEICTEYNNTPQESRVMGGDHIVYMSPEDAWLEYRARDASGAIVEPLILPKELEDMLSDHQQQVTVTRNGISLFSGKYRYRNTELANHIGEIMIASFDPDDPSALVVQDMKGERFIGVPRVADVPALADSETLSLASKETAAFNRVAKARYSQLAAKWRPKGRPVIADAQSRERARNMREARSDGREQFNREARNLPAIKLREQFMRPPVDDEEVLSAEGQGNSIREVQNFIRGES